MGISLMNDQYKNQGIGTAAEKQTLRYAFEQIGMETVYADALITNLRSRHVLEKVGFRETHANAQFAYYQCDKDSWKG
jgi:RimJ/RimL family protein N-acetyltransferase